MASRTSLLLMCQACLVPRCIAFGLLCHSCHLVTLSGERFNLTFLMPLHDASPQAKINIPQPHFLGEPFLPILPPNPIKCPKQSCLLIWWHCDPKPLFASHAVTEIYANSRLICLFRHSVRQLAVLDDEGPTHPCS